MHRSKQLNDHVTRRWMSVFEKYSRAFDPSIFPMRMPSKTRLDNTCGPVLVKTYHPPRHHQGGNINGGKKKGRSCAICLVPILSVASLSRWTLTTMHDDALVPRSWGHVPLSGTCIVHQSVWFYEKPFPPTPASLFAPPVTPSFGEIYCTPICNRF